MVIYVECGLLYYAYYNAVIFFIFLGIGVCFVFWGWFMVYFFLFCWVGLCVVCGYITQYYNAVTLYSLVVVYVFGFFWGGLGVSE